MNENITWMKPTHLSLLFFSKTEDLLAYPLVMTKCLPLQNEDTMLEKKI